VIVTIMQPTYLPWMGYFDLIDQCDVFLFLDTVAFSRQSWQQRNRILTAHGPLWLTVPVRHSSDGRISEMEIDNSRPWRRKHWSTIEGAYRGAVHWKATAQLLAPVYDRDWRSLAELNVTTIEALARQIGVGARFECASAIGQSPRRREGALVDYCLELGATTYLSPAGSFAYLESDLEFAKHGIELRFQHYEHPTYPQAAREFVPYLSVVDLLMATGPEAASVIRRGRRGTRTFDEMRAVAGAGSEGDQ